MVELLADGNLKLYICLLSQWSYPVGEGVKKEQLSADMSAMGGGRLPVRKKEGVLITA